MTLPDCPNCGNRDSVRRETVDWGTPVALVKTYCALCGWSTGWNGTDYFKGSYDPMQCVLRRGLLDLSVPL